MKKQPLLMMLTILFFGCIKPIELNSIVSHEPILVVDAVLTNELKHHIINLSKSISLDSTNIIKVSNAQVKITDNNNNVYAFSEGKKGIYTSNDIFKAEKNKQYTLEIVTNDGTHYTSTKEEIYGFNTIDEIELKKEKNKFNEEGVTIYIKSDGSKNDNAQYYRYKFEETYKIVAPYWSSIMLDKTKLPNFVFQKTTFDEICYQTNDSKAIILHESTLLNAKNIQFPIQFLKRDDYKISYRYSSLIKQYIQSPDAFFYNKKLLKISTSQSLFTQTQPGTLVGNISSNSNNKVIGYFEVNSVTKKRIFFNYSDFFTNNQFNYPIECFFRSPPTETEGPSGANPLFAALHGGWIFRGVTSPVKFLRGPFTIVKKDCGDCKKFGTTIKPKFWKD